MRLAVIGGTGFIGPSIVRHLAEAGHWVATISRSKDRHIEGAATHFAAHREDPGAIADFCRGNRIDTVVDLLALVPEATQPLLAMLDGAVDRYVMASSLDVYRNYGGFHRCETAEPILDSMSEDAPLRASRFPYRDSALAREPGREWLADYDKIPIEEMVRALSQTSWTILRLPMVFGPGDRQRRFIGYTQPMAIGAARIEIAKGWANWTTTYSYVGNVGAAIALAAAGQAGANEAFNIGEETPVDQVSWVRRFADIAGWRGEIVLVDDERSAMATFLQDLDLRFPLICDSSKIRSRLGFHEVVPLEDAVRWTYEYDCKSGWPGQARS